MAGTAPIHDRSWSVTQHTGTPEACIRVARLAFAFRQKQAQPHVPVAIGTVLAVASGPIAEEKHPITLAVGRGQANEQRFDGRLAAQLTG